MNTSNMSETEDHSAHGKPLSIASSPETPTAGNAKRPRIAFFGHFGADNWGNESTLQAILCCLRRLAPNAAFTCICTGPDTVARTYNITAVPSRTFSAERRTPQSRPARWARKLVVGVPGELRQWLRSLKTLRGTDALVVPGTGLLNDVDTFLSWGPYDMFRWSVAARLCRCKILFVSVGAGPIHSRAGRFFVKSALSLAEFRSYRDESTQQCLEGIGFRAANDPVYPDLAFSLSEDLVPERNDSGEPRPVVGIGLMKNAGQYGLEKPTSAVYTAYLQTLVEFVEWLLLRGYNVRLLIGDVVDTPAVREFRSLLNERPVTQEAGRVIDEPIESVEGLLRQLAATDLVVATRFHNVLLALLLNRPVIAISFHHKCTSLMRQTGLSEYCQDIDRLNSGWLFEQFSQLEENAGNVKLMIAERVETNRHALAEQYAIILRKIWPDRVSGPLP